MSLLCYCSFLKRFTTAKESGKITSTGTFGGAVGFIDQPRKQNKKQEIEGVEQNLKKKGMIEKKGDLPKKWGVSKTLPNMLNEINKVP